VTASVRSLRPAAPWDAHFVAHHALLWPLARAAAPFAGATEWPPVATWTAAFGAAPPPVRFVPSGPRRRRGRPRPFDPARLYDATIIEHGQVPSRRRHWHDFLNALVWATFPRAKRALHARQGAAIARRLGPGVAQLPAHRTRELDGLAMIDEGGVIALATPTGDRMLVFGHALYEGFVLRAPPMTARVVRVAPVAAAAAGADLLAQADAALAAALDDPERVLLPAELPSIHVPSGSPPPGWAPPDMIARR
jgi:hypothetical protein